MDRGRRGAGQARAVPKEAVVRLAAEALAAGQCRSAREAPAAFSVGILVCSATSALLEGWVWLGEGGGGCLLCLLTRMPWPGASGGGWACGHRWASLLLHGAAQPEEEGARRGEPVTGGSRQMHRRRSCLGRVQETCSRRWPRGGRSLAPAGEADAEPRSRSTRLAR